jgi:hypothetical protein
MKKLCIFLGLLLSLASTTVVKFAWAVGTSYYVDSASVGGDGTTQNLTGATAAFKTLAAANAALTGDQHDNFLLLHRGETWRESMTIAAVGTSGHQFTVGAYGTGAKPKILGSADLSSSGLWTNESGSLWYAATAVEIGSMIYNNEAAYGVARSAKAGMVAQGDMWWDSPNSRVYMYSASNPGTYYSHIEAGTWTDGVGITAKNYITVENLDIRYCAEHGVDVSSWGSSATGITVQDCDISWIGSLWHPASKAGLGNGIQFYGAASNIIARRNRISQCMDAGIVPEQDSEGVVFNTIATYDNVIDKCEYGIEIGGNHAGTTVTAVTIYNNTIYNSGGGFSHADRPDPSGTGIMLWGPDVTLTSLTIKNNLIAGGIYCVGKGNTDWTGITMDYQLYHPTGNSFGYNKWPIFSAPESFTTWKTHGPDAHSQNTDPLLVNPTAATPDFSLQAGSPAIDAGTNVSLVTDYAGALVPTGKAQDLGALERQGPWYVANAGSDSAVGGGQNSAAPVQTIAWVNAAAFPPGGYVYFNRGDTWREQLTVPSSGSVSGQVTFGKYGSTGADPIISGADAITSWSLYGTTTSMSLLAHAVCAGNSCTTGGINTTGATLLIAVAYYASAAPSAPTDSKGNTWRASTAYSDGEGTPHEIEIYYSYDHGGSALSVGAAHTFTCGNSNNGPWLMVYAVSGTLTTSAVYDTVNGAGSAGGNVTSIATGSITPAVTGEFIASGLAVNADYGAIPGIAVTSLTLLDASSGNAGEDAYLIDANTNPLNPTWSWTTSQKAVATIAAFKPSGAAYNIYQATVTTQPHNVWINGTAGTKQASLAALQVPGDWYWDSGANVLYLVSVASPTGIEAQQRDYCIYSTRTYVTVTGITCEKGRAGIYFTGSNTTIDGVTVQHLMQDDGHTGTGAGIRWGNG